MKKSQAVLRATHGGVLRLAGVPPIAAYVLENGQPLLLAEHVDRALVGEPFVGDPRALMTKVAFLDTGGLEVSGYTDTDIINCICAIGDLDEAGRLGDRRDLARAATAMVREFAKAGFGIMTGTRPKPQPRPVN